MRRVAIVNNGRAEPKRLITLLSGSNISVFSYDEAAAVSSGFDLIVLSGTSHLTAVFDTDKLQAELELIRTTQSPLLGVCFGTQLINLAFGGTLKEIGIANPLRTAVEIEVLVDDPLFNHRKHFLAYDAHRWVIDTPAPEIEVLARSSHGPEVVRHKTLPIYGFQFHPEKMTDETYGDELYASFINRFAPLV